MRIHIGPTNSPPLVGRSTQSGGVALSTACLDNIFNVNAGDYLVCGQDIPNGIILFPNYIIEYINESNSIINQTTNTGTVTFN